MTVFKHKSCYMLARFDRSPSALCTSSLQYCSQQFKAGNLHFTLIIYFGNGCAAFFAFRGFCYSLFASFFKQGFHGFPQSYERVI